MTRNYNSLIKEFIGYEKHSQLCANSYCSPEFDGYYGSSWTWLMELINKIESLPGVNTEYESFGGNSFQFKIWYDGKCVAGITEAELTVKMRDIFNVAVMFIMWHNEMAVKNIEI